MQMTHHAKILRLINNNDASAFGALAAGLQTKDRWGFYNDQVLIDAAYRASPAMFNAASGFLNVHGESIKAGMALWNELLLKNRHDIYCYMVAKYNSYKNPMNPGNENYLIALLKRAKNDPTITEESVLAHCPDLFKSIASINKENDAKESPFKLVINLNWIRLAKMMLTYPPLEIPWKQNNIENMVDVLCHHHQYEFLNELLTTKLPDFYGPAVLTMWYRYLNISPNPELLKIIRLLAPIHKVVHKGPEIHPTPDKYKTSAYVNAYFSTYGNITNFDSLHDRTTTIKKIFAKYAALFFDTDFCVKLLTTFDQTLQAQWAQAFPGIEMKNALSYEAKTDQYASCLWPIPVEHHAKTDAARLFSKKSFLERQCKAFMIEHGYVGGFSKFYDLVPSDAFAQAIKNWDLFTESSIHPNFLTHSKNIHNIGRILFILAWESKELDFNKTYLENGTTNTLSLKDVFAEMFNPQYASISTQYNPWASLCDARNWSKKTISDPWQFHSILMHECQESLPALSLLMRHSFCKSLYRMRDYLEDSTNEKWTIDQVWHDFIIIRRPNTIMSHTESQLSWLRKKGKISSQYEPNENSAIAKHRLS